ncbi:MAG: hypothetical protein Q7T54_01710 [Candidatus Levybacteria bacterium]|nr:hypothetical protein [Candidatus Levybacteria bacterium]
METQEQITRRMARRQKTLDRLNSEITSAEAALVAAQARLDVVKARKFSLLHRHETDFRLIEDQLFAQADGDLEFTDEKKASLRMVLAGARIQRFDKRLQEGEKPSFQEVLDLATESEKYVYAFLGISRPREEVPS